MLTIISDFVGLFGGFIVSYYMLNITGGQYWNGAYQALVWNDLAQGLLKPFVFALVISLVGCFYGLRTSGGTQGVGRATTQAVVVASVWIFVITLFITRIFVTQQ
jgi:phospholipid/cholesterol/gamma-HCH transport system permease protein